MTPNRSGLALAVVITATLLTLPASATTWNTLDGAAPLVIGHRGASGYRPEHTLASYDLAISMGANFIEPDLVMTRDGVLVARHEPVIGSTTNVASVFASRKTTKTIDGVTYTDNWFVEDFTLAELKTLRAVQPNAARSAAYNGMFEVPTLAEVINLAQTRSAELGRPVGIYPELKHSSYMRGVSLAQGRSATYFEDTLVSSLHTAYGNDRNAPVFIQSFEVGNLQYLNTQTDIRLVQLMDAWDVNTDGSMDVSVPPYDRPYDLAINGDTRTFADLLSASGLAFVAGYADGIGPWKPYLVKTVADGVERTGDGVLDARDRQLDGSTGVIEAAHDAGLLVHTWTFRNDNIGYQLGFADPQAEMAYYMQLGVDGVFTDFPDTGVAALQAAAVPEPQTWALLLGGVAVLGALGRRRSGAGRLF